MLHLQTPVCKERHVGERATSVMRVSRKPYLLHVGTRESGLCAGKSMTFHPEVDQSSKVGAGGRRWVMDSTRWPARLNGARGRAQRGASAAFPPHPSLRCAQPRFARTDVQ